MSFEEQKMSKNKISEQIFVPHYNFTPLEMCLSEVAYTAGCCSLKAWFIPVGVAFGSIQTRLE